MPETKASVLHWKDKMVQMNHLRKVALYCNRHFNTSYIICSFCKNDLLITCLLCPANRACWTLILCLFFFFFFSAILIIVLPSSPKKENTNKTSWWPSLLNHKLPPFSLRPHLPNFLTLSSCKQCLLQDHCSFWKILHCHRTERLYIYVCTMKMNAHCLYLHGTNIQNAYIRYKKVYIYILMCDR